MRSYLRLKGKEEHAQSVCKGPVVTAEGVQEVEAGQYHWSTRREEAGEVVGTLWRISNATRPLSRAVGKSVASGAQLLVFKSLLYQLLAVLLNLSVCSCEI